MVKLLSIDVGIKNLSFCYFDTCPNKTQIIEWKNISVTDQNVKKMKLDTITDCVLHTLNEHFDEDFETNIVIIENQPMLKNGLMKTISVIIYTYFNMMKLQYANIDEVKFVSASNKLKCKKTQNINKDTYKDRKNLSIETAKVYINDHFPDRLNWLNTQKKLDDLCDSQLLGIYYIEHILKYTL